MIRERSAAPGPKRILALDGGGIRGALTLGYLAEIEALLRRRTGVPDLVLRDYFDLIGGTSTGSIIAAGLAIGMSAEELRESYLTLGPKVFASRRRGLARTRSIFDAKSLEAELERAFEDRTLGDPSITTGLCIVAKRADTRSTWPLLNHPDGRYYEANRRILLRRAIRASTAAPMYFVPERIDVGAGGGVGAFIDGGVSMANNPALLLFLVATLRGFPFHWRTGRDRLLLVSIGTGTWWRGRPTEEVLDHRVWNWATEVPSMLMEDAARENDLLLRYFGATPTPASMDSEMGDLSHDLITGEPLLTYVRYNCSLEEDRLAEIGRTDLVPRLKSLRQMAAGANAPALTEIGRLCAEREVEAAAFPEAFDL